MVSRQFGGCNKCHSWTASPTFLYIKYEAKPEAAEQISFIWFLQKEV